jgi:hypothetical protein
MIKKRIGKHFEPYLAAKGMKLTYLAPKDYMYGMAFQEISGEDYTDVKKLGDPAGYCLAWSYWYLELRVHNPDVHPIDIIKRAMKKINNSSDDSQRKFIDFIRNYAVDLDKTKNKFMLDAGISEYNVYNIDLSDNDTVLLKQHIRKAATELQ